MCIYAYDFYFIFYMLLFDCSGHAVWSIHLLPSSRAIAQAVSRWLPTAAARVQTLV
jgi:hypothetical protein